MTERPYPSGPQALTLECEECNFEGEVIAHSEFGLAKWRCPKCGHDHDDYDITGHYDDPDLDNDRRFDR
jgi:hypothetical protein